jgi:hypothetical protein
VRLGHKTILQSLPRLLTLYFEFGSKVVSAKAISQRLKVAQNQVCGMLAAVRVCCGSPRGLVPRGTVRVALSSMPDPPLLHIPTHLPQITPRQVDAVMKALIVSIPTYKWLLVLPQLTSRMCHAHVPVQVCSSAL